MPLTPKKPTDPLSKLATYRPEIIRGDSPTSERGPQAELAEAAMAEAEQVLEILVKRFPGLRMVQLALWFPEGRVTKATEKSPTTMARLCTATATDEAGMTPEDLAPFLDEMVYATCAARLQIAQPGSPMRRDMFDPVPPSRARDAVDLMKWLNARRPR